MPQLSGTRDAVQDDAAAVLTMPPHEPGTFAEEVIAIDHSPHGAPRSMQHLSRQKKQVYLQPEVSLSVEELQALQKACAPVGRLSFPRPDVIRKLRQHGFVEIVLGGVQITPAGLEYLVLERKRERAKPSEGDQAASA